MTEVMPSQEQETRIWSTWYHSNRNMYIGQTGVMTVGKTVYIKMKSWQNHRYISKWSQDKRKSQIDQDDAMTEMKSQYFNEGETRTGVRSHIHWARYSNDWSRIMYIDQLGITKPQISIKLEPMHRLESRQKLLMHWYQTCTKIEVRPCTLDQNEVMTGIKPYWSI